MSSSSLARGSDDSRVAADANGAIYEKPASKVRITVIVQDRYRVDAGPMTGKKIMEAAHVPAGFVLYRRAKAGNEPIPDEALIGPHNGDHFFARPPSSAANDEEL